MEGSSPAFSGWNRGPIETALTELADGSLLPDEEESTLWTLHSEE